MDAQSSLRWFFSFFFILAVFRPDVFAGPTFRYGGEFNLPILDKQGPGGSLTEALIQVPDHLTICDLDVEINLTHTNVFDLQIFIQGPDQTRLCLNMYDFKNEFFKGADYVQTIFDAEAEIPIEQGTAPFTGRFRPKAGNLLSVFDGRDAYGIWRLQIYDMWYWDTGNLESAELIISISEMVEIIPAPPALTLLALGAGLTLLFRRRRL
jgi:subtilisin-like proprotein convertase family protein